MHGPDYETLRVRLVDYYLYRQAKTTSLDLGRGNKLLLEGLLNNLLLSCAVSFRSVVSFGSAIPP